MGGKKKKVTIGYKYFMGLHMGICRGPIDAIHQIRVGDKVAWRGKLGKNSSTFIFEPKLFGGEEQEGGIEGVLDVMTGDKDQPRNARLSAMLGGLTSAFRGVATVFFDGLVCAMSPYPKEWSFMVQKTKAGWHGGECWYPQKCEIVLLDGSIELLGSGWEYVIETFTEPNTAWNNFVPPLDGWKQGGELPFSTNGMSGGAYWKPTRSNIWLRRKMQVKAIGLTMKIGADNGCAVWIDGNFAGVSNPTNEPVSGNEKNPVSYQLGALGTVDVLVKAYAEISISDEGGNIVDIEFSGNSLIAMNPAHILRRLYTDPSIGRGLPASRLDEDSWRAAADKFYAEGFGLCMKWARTGSIADFAAEVINHAGAVVYTSRRTGKIVLKAIRDDYDINDLPLYTPDTGLLGFDDDEASAQTGGINEIVVNYKDPVAKADKAVREKNLGAIMAAGGITISESVDYPGIPTEALARRVARRDLQAKSGFIKRFSVRLDRRGRDIMPGGVFRISDASRGIENMVLRAGRVEYGTITDGTITVTALQDVFGLPATVYREPEENAYVPPDTSIRASVLQAAMEAPYRDLVQAMSASDLEILAPDAGYLHAAAVRPTTLSQSFALQTRVAPAAYTPAADMATFCPGGKLSAALDYLDTTAVLTDAQALDELQPGTAALIGGEIVRVDAVNVATSTLTIARGCADTVPAQHAAGTAVLCYDSWGGDDQTEYMSGVSVEAKLLTNTGAGQLSASVAPVQTVTFAGRAARPYPPGDVKLNGERYPQEITGDLEITWAHRDRLLQADNLIDTVQPSVGPEPGTTYAVELYDGASSTLLHSETGIASTTAAVPSSAFAYDNRLELYSVRGGLESWQRQVRRFTWGARLWTPADLVVAPKIWLDDTSAVGIVGGLVSSWQNIGSLGGGFTQATAGARPAVVDDLAGKRILRFDGSASYLTADTGLRAVFSGVDSGYIFAVYKKRTTDPSPINRPVLWGSTAVNTFRFGLLASGNQLNAQNKPSGGGRRIDADVWNGVNASRQYVGEWLMHGVLLDYVGRKVEQHLNGVTDGLLLNAFTASGSSAVAAARDVRVGWSMGSDAPADIDLAALICCANTPSQADLQRIEGWAAHRYGLTNNLPDDHPYKTTPPYIG